MKQQHHMKEEVYDLVPQWFKDSKEDQYTVMVGNDIDSLASAAMLNQVLGWKINWFYDFHDIYVLDEENKTERVGVDFAIENGKTFDNHVTLMKQNDYRNEESVNMNVIYKIARKNYQQKYAMSTVLLLWSLLGLPLPKTDEGKKILLTIDSSFKGHYQSKFRKTHDEWLRKLGFEELIEFMDTKTTFDELDKTIRKRYGLSKKIYMSTKLDGRLKNTGIMLKEISNLLGVKIELPKDQFTKVEELDRGNANLDEHRQKKGKALTKNSRVFSFALTYSSVCSYTMLKT